MSSATDIDPIPSPRKEKKELYTEKVVQVSECTDSFDEESTELGYSNLSWKQKLSLRFKKLFAPAIQSRLESTPEERRFLRKLDLVLMSYGCLAHLIKSIDQSNYLNAYVSGMKEDVSNLNGFFLT